MSIKVSFKVLRCQKESPESCRSPGTYQSVKQLSFEGWKYAVGRRGNQMHIRMHMTIFDIDIMDVCLLAIDMLR